MNENVNGWWVDWWRYEWMEWGKADCLGKSKLNPTSFQFREHTRLPSLPGIEAKFVPYQDLGPLVLHDWFCRAEKWRLLYKLYANGVVLSNCQFTTSLLPLKPCLLKHTQHLAPLHKAT